MRHAATALAAVTAAAAVVFSLWPGLDLLASAPFYDPATQSWLSEAPPFAALREVLWVGAELAVLVFALLCLLSLALRHRAAVPARLWGFGFLAMALGPGLLVNLILKDNWGRARPRMIAEFGGDALFTPVLQVADQCTRNCSFVSGEVASIATLALAIWLLSHTRLRAAARHALGVGLVALTALSAFLRLAGGGHFLSDVIFAILLPALLTLALWRLTGCDRVANRLSAAAIAADLRAPFNLFRRRK